MNRKIGKISKQIIELLKLDYTTEIPIYIGDSNLKHMKQSHEDDFLKYEKQIEDIIENPTYVARNEKKQSVEFIKEYKVDDEFVLVAVRITGKKQYFARTMYVMADEKVEKYFKHGYFKNLDNST